MCSIHSSFSLCVADDLSGVEPLDGTKIDSTDHLSDRSRAQSKTGKAAISTLAQDIQPNRKDLGHSGLGSTSGSKHNTDAMDRERNATNVKASSKSGELATIVHGN